MIKYYIRTENIVDINEILDGIENMNISIINRTYFGWYQITIPTHEANTLFLLKYGDKHDGYVTEFDGHTYKVYALP